MNSMDTDHGITVWYEKQGSGPPLVLVHGSFSDHRTNWEFVLPHLSPRYTIYAVARRGRGKTDATEGHRLEDEGMDVAAVIRAIGEPVFMLGHSYGALVALQAALVNPGSVRKLVLYEPAWPKMLADGATDSLEAIARTGDWEGLCFHFFHNVLSVPAEELNALRATELWAPIIEDAKASLGDLRALWSYDFQPQRFAELRMPVLLQIGTESPRQLFATDALAAVLGDVRIASLEGQAHEGMTTAPGLYADSINGFLADAMLKAGV